MKAIVAVFELPTEVSFNVNDDAATAVTAPMAGVSAVPAFVSTDVLTLRPPTVALLADRMSPEHITVTGPALTAALTVSVMVPAANTADDAVLGFGSNSQNVVPLTTDATSPPGNTMVIVPAVESADEVVKVTVALVVAPIVMDGKFKATFVTAPVVAVLTWAGTVSTVVLMLIPVVPPTVANTASFAANVNPEQVTLIEPAGTADLTLTLIVSAVALSTTEATVGLGTSSQLVAVATAVSNPAGKAKIISLSTTIAVDVVKSKLAV